MNILLSRLTHDELLTYIGLGAVTDRPDELIVELTGRLDKAVARIEYLQQELDDLMHPLDDDSTKAGLVIPETPSSTPLTKSIDAPR